MADVDLLRKIAISLLLTGAGIGVIFAACVVWVWSNFHAFAPAGG